MRRHRRTRAARPEPAWGSPSSARSSSASSPAAPDGKAITEVARRVALDNPFGRRVVSPGDAGYPAADVIASWTAGVPSPGAVVLHPSGTPFKVLTIVQARSEMVLDKAFADAAAEGQP